MGRRGERDDGFAGVMIEVRIVGELRKSLNKIYTEVLRASSLDIREKVGEKSEGKIGIGRKIGEKRKENWGEIKRKLERNLCGRKPKV
jgi:hypothetical protein